MKTVIIGERYKEKLDKPLVNHGFIPLWLPENPYVDNRLASHTDLSVFQYDKTIVLASYLKEETKLVNYLTNRGFDVRMSEVKQGIVYPNDVNLCAAVIGNKLLHNTRFTDPRILELHLKQIIVNQGYARCTVLTLDNKNIITADYGICRAVETEEINVLKISEEGISLDGFDKGFIGGATFKNEDTIYFTGKIDHHSNAKQIKDFIFSCGLKCCVLSDEPVFDIGGAVVI